MSQPYLSAVITCFNEEATIETFINLLIEALNGTRVDYEIILVNDGSADATFAVLERLVQRHARIKVAIDLMANAGQAAAITAGLVETCGDYVLMMDSDLQLVPGDVGRLIEACRGGADIATGYRRDRQDALRRTLPSLLANWVMRRVSKKPLRDFGCTFRLVSRPLIDAFKFGPERVLSTPLLISCAGRVVEVPVEHRARPHGKSGWTFRKLWRYQADNMVVLAEPVFQAVGLSSLGVAILLVARVMLDPLLHWSLLGTVSNGLVLNIVLAGTLMLTGLVCVVGEFVVRCHRSVLARPAYVVRRRIIRPRAG